MRIGYAEGKLEGDWAVFAKIAGYFVYRVPPDDREDFLQDLLVEMDRVKVKYEAKGKILREAGLMRVARYEVLGYWEKRRYRRFGLNCNNCKVDQRRECYTMRLPSQCPKGKSRHILRLNKIINDGDGDKPIELNLIDDKEMDLDARLDARRILQGLPKRLVKTGYKIYAGIPLETEEKEYLKRWQKVHRQKVRRDHLDERILELLRKNPQGLTRSDLSMRLQVYVREINRYLALLIKGEQVISVKRESTRGRPPTPLLLIAGAPIPEVKKVAEERDERIRQAYFMEGWSIKRINTEMHRDKRTIRRAIYGIKIERR